MSRTTLLFIRGVFSIAIAILLLVLTGKPAPTIGLLEPYRSPLAFSATSNVWERASNPRASLAAGIPDRFFAVRLNRSALESTLAAAPGESFVALAQSDTLLDLPLPDGKFATFRVQDAPILEPDFQAKFPDIRSFRILGVDDPSVSGRVDISPKGFHATILANDDLVTITRASDEDETLYASYGMDSVETEEIRDFCALTKSKLIGSEPQTAIDTPQIATGDVLRTFRFALATTWEFSNDAGGGTTAGTIAALNTWMSAVNAILERDLSIRLLLVNNVNVIYSTERGFTAASDPFTDNDSVELAGQSQTVIEQQIGAANYNLGHVISFGAGGGFAPIGSVCGNLKATASSPLRRPTGNPNSLKIFVHELGHSLGAHHSFNGTNRICGPARAESAAVEPGAGTTIMSYRRNCGTDNNTGPELRSLRFHAFSISQITDVVVRGTGAACPVTTPTGNTPPIVNAPAAFNIPKNTPFQLTATGSDPDRGDSAALTYAWEQIDAGGAFPNPPYTDQNDAANTTRPLFRSFDVTKEPTRVFPSLRYILNNANNVPEAEGNERPAESLPQVARTLNFRVTARDNVGGVNDATTRLTVDANSGPFLVTAPNTSVNWIGGTPQAITWNVANTTNAPVSTANVKITLSTDGGQTFPIVLAESAPNSGTFNATVPDGISTTTARVKVEAVGNIFFDVSDANFTIAPGGNCPVINDIAPRTAAVGGQVVITGVNFTGVTAVRFPNNVNAVFTVNSNTQITATVPAGAVGGPITITKPGCGDAQTTTITVCAGAPAILQIDNGELGGFDTLASPGNPVYVVNRLTPASYPATLSSVILPSRGNLPVGTTINIIAGSSAGGANIDNASTQAYPRTLPAGDTPMTFSIPPLTITSGDFIVGYSYDIAAAGSVYSRGDLQNRSYTSRNGVNFTLRNVNFMVRAEIFTGVCTPGQCGVNLSAAELTVPAAGGPGTFNITTSAPDCPWEILRGASWINLTSTANGNGNSTVTFTVAPNEQTAPRSATISVGGRTFTVNQAAGTGPACPYNVTPASSGAFGSGPRTGATFDIVTAPGCAWTLTPSDPWITITSATSGTGNATVTYNISSNTSPNVRRGGITVGGIRFGIEQLGGAPPCAFNLNPTAATVAGNASAGNNIGVATADGCGWTATTNDAWITITSANGTGNGTATFSVAANPSTTNPRVGTITIGGQAFAVTQSPAAPANCVFALTTPGANFPTAASAGNVASITANAGCPWTAVTADNWITITAGQTGNGNGTTTYSVAENTGPARTGAITIGGQNFRIDQAAAALPCTPITGGLVNWYRGENNSLDSIGTNHGVNTGAVQYAPGRTNLAFSFNGTDASVAIPRTIADDFTIEFWIRFPANVTGGPNSTDWRQGMGIIGTANDEFGVSLGDGKVMFGVGNTTVTSTVVVNDGGDYHVVATRNRGSGLISLYVDGAPQGTATAGIGSLIGSPQMVIGRRGTTGTFLLGFVDEIKLFNVELTAGQARLAFDGCTTAARAGVDNSLIREGDANPNAFSEAAFTVRLSSPSAFDVVIDYETRDGSAVDGFDYDGVSDTLVIPAGETTGTIFVPVYNDDEDEPDRFFFVELTGANNAAISDSEAVGMIIDDDAACESTLNAIGRTFSAAASSGNSFTFQTGAGCEWSAASLSPWITASASGSGSGTVTYSVAANSGSGRTGYISVAGKLFTIFQAASPTAPTFNVTGRVASFGGIGIPNVIVTLTDQSGVTRTARTNGFGYFRFSGIAAGQNCVVRVRTAKERRFSNASQIITVNGDYDDVNFNADN